MPGRDHLDRFLSRAPSKDLARDYAAAAIERRAARLAPLADQVRSLRGQSQEIASVAATIQDVGTTASQLSDARAALAKAAARVYANPSQALERLAADSRAPERLWVGQTAAYGQLNGRAPTRFRQPDLAHQAATRPPCPPSGTPSTTITRRSEPPPRRRPSRAPFVKACPSCGGS